MNPSSSSRKKLVLNSETLITLAYGPDFTTGRPAPVGTKTVSCVSTK